MLGSPLGHPNHDFQNELTLCVPGWVQGKMVEYQATVTGARLLRDGVNPVPLSGSPAPERKRQRVGEHVGG